MSARLISGKSLSAEEEDIDVARERERVYEGKAHKDLLRICDLTKVQYCAVHLSLKQNSDCMHSAGSDFSFGSDTD